MLQFTNSIKRKAIDSVINGSINMLQRKRALILLGYYSPSHIEIRNIKIEGRQFVLSEALYQCLIIAKRKKSFHDAAKILRDFCPKISIKKSISLIENELVFPVRQPS